MSASALALPFGLLPRVLGGVLRGIGDVVVPARCPGCAAIVRDDGQYCASCWAGLRFITAPQCATCGVPFAFDIGADARCGDCLRAPPRFASARAAFIYDGTARTVLLAFKNRDRGQLARIMAPPMARAGEAVLSGDALVVPVPLHRWRLLQRGYNQAALLAQHIARLRGLELSVDALERVRASPRSRGMGRIGRAANVRGVFRVARPQMVRGRTVVLIDDVLTTGATANACARLLLRHGARRVHIVTWARVVRGDAAVT